MDSQLSTQIPLNFSKWSERQDFHLRPPGPKPGALKTELRSVKMVSAGRFALPLPPFRTENVAATPRAVCPGDWRAPGAWFGWIRTLASLKPGPGENDGPEGTCTLSLPADNGLLR